MEEDKRAVALAETKKGCYGKCGENCPYMKVSTPQNCGIVHYKVDETLEKLAIAADKMANLDKAVAVLVVKMGGISALIGIIAGAIAGVITRNMTF